MGGKESCDGSVIIGQVREDEARTRVCYLG